MEKTANIKTWLLAIRAKTLIASICPVLVGTFLAFAKNFNPLMFLCTILSAIFVQIGTNIANDYYDFIQGADTKNRKGPQRISQSGLLPLKIIKQGFIFCFAIAFTLGLYPIIQGGLNIAILGGLSLFLGVFYTKGKFSLAYTGLADICVLLFFGVFASGFTYYLQTGIHSSLAFCAGLGPGAISTAILCANNLRDMEEDKAANKKTLVVRFGKGFGKIEYVACLSIASCTLFFFSPYVFLVFPLLCYPPIKSLFETDDQKNFIPLLENTAKLLVIYTLLFALGALS